MTKHYKIGDIKRGNIELSTMSDIIKLIQQVGFPIAVCIYLLWRYEKRLADISKSIEKLSGSLSEVSGYLKGIKDG